MYTEIFLRLEPLASSSSRRHAARAGATTYGSSTCRPTRRRLTSSSSRSSSRTPSASGVPRLPPRTSPRSWTSPSETKKAPPGQLLLRRRTLAVLHGSRGPRAQPGHDRLHRQGRGRGDRRQAPRGVAERRPEEPPRAPERHHDAGRGPRGKLIHDLDTLLPARDLLRNRKKYFIGVLDPCASIEFTRGCPWDCSFCSAWTFYGRSYRKRSVEKDRRGARLDQGAGRLHRGRRGPSIQEDHGYAIGKEIEKRKINKKYYPRDARRRAAQEQGSLQVLEDARPRVHVPRPRGANRRGGPEDLPQARLALEELRGARVRALARDHGRDQHHRGLRLGREALPDDPATGRSRSPRSSTSRSTRLPGDGDVHHRVAPVHDARLQAVRHPARRAADDQAPARPLLRGAREDASRCST